VQALERRRYMLWSPNYFYFWFWNVYSAPVPDYDSHIPMWTNQESYSYCLLRSIRYIVVKCLFDSHWPDAITSLRVPLLVPRSRPTVPTFPRTARWLTVIPDIGGSHVVILLKYVQFRCRHAKLSVIPVSITICRLYWVRVVPWNAVPTYTERLKYINST
jgi:hypothetical protein